MNLAKSLEVFIDSIGRGKKLHPLVSIKRPTAGNKGFVDVDRFPKSNPYQCVDLVDYWVLYLGGPNLVGNAIDYVGKTYGWLKWIKKGKGDPLPGDLVVFDVGEYGHIAIVRKKLSANSIQTWSQNDPLGRGVVLRTYSTRDVVGYLRLKGSTAGVDNSSMEALKTAKRAIGRLMYRLYLGRNASLKEQKLRESRPLNELLSVGRGKEGKKAAEKLTKNVYRGILLRNPSAKEIAKRVKDLSEAKYTPHQFVNEVATSAERKKLETKLGIKL